MRNLARRDAFSGEVVSLARYVREPFALDDFMRRVWSIVPDPQDAEFVRSPAYMIGCQCFEGDCDDAATLAASVLIALGIPAMLVAVRMATAPDFSHVFTRVPRLNLDIDPIVPLHQMPIRYGEAMVLNL